MRLSIVIICWNDLEVIKDCLRSIFEETRETEFEVIMSDNGSTDGSVAYVRENFPSVKILENGENLGFARGNNVGIREAEGEYVLILNPDTIVKNRAFDKWIQFADEHGETGAFGCRVLNPDGSWQDPAKPLPSVFGYLLSALYLRPLGYLSSRFDSDIYVAWKGESERFVGYQSGCCILFRRNLLEQLGGFDERFFYHFEETDLCYRSANSGNPVLFFPGAEIIHLGGQSVGRFPVRFALEKYRNRYRFFYKSYGGRAAKKVRKVVLLDLYVRKFGYGLVKLFKADEAVRNRLALYKAAITWNRKLDPIRFCENGEEYDIGHEPLASPQNMADPPKNWLLESQH